MSDEETEGLRNASCIAKGIVTTVTALAILILGFELGRNPHRIYYVPSGLAAVLGGVAMLLILAILMRLLVGFVAGITVAVGQREVMQADRHQEHVQAQIRNLTDLQRNMNASQQYLIRDAQVARRALPAPEEPSHGIRFNQALLDELKDADVIDSE